MKDIPLTDSFGDAKLGLGQKGKKVCIYNRERGVILIEVDRSIRGKPTNFGNGKVVACKEEKMHGRSRFTITYITYVLKKSLSIVPTSSAQRDGSVTRAHVHILYGTILVTLMI